MKTIRTLQLAVASIALVSLGSSGSAFANEDPASQGDDGRAIEKVAAESSPEAGQDAVRKDGGDNVIVIWPVVYGLNPVVVPKDELAGLLRVGGDNIIVIWPGQLRINPRTVVALEDTHF